MRKRTGPIQRYIEDVALFLEEQGLPRIAGRIVGLLLTCDPPHRSAGQLAQELGASKGSISTMTRLLVESGTLERTSLPGGRTTYFALRPDSLERKLERRLAATVAFRPLAERGLKLLAGQPRERTARLRLVRAMYAFMEQEMSLMLARWREQRERLSEQGP